MDPKDIARLIEETDIHNEEGYDKCPDCGNKYAAINDGNIACPNNACKNYNKEYGETVESVESAYIEIVDYINDIHDINFYAFEGYLDLAKGGINYLGLEIPEDSKYISGEYVMVFWRGYPRVGEQALLDALARYIAESDPDVEE
jgi:hypothetical protein